MDRAVPKHLLHVQGDEEEHREQRATEQDAHHIGARQRPQPEDPERNQRCLRAQLDHHEGCDQHHREHQQADDLGGAPASATGIQQRVGQHR